MATRIRAYHSARDARGTSRALADIEFCDRCAQVCDAARRSVAYRERARLAAGADRR